jgi:hypothetical protein
MKPTSIDAIERWYGNEPKPESWDTVLERAKEEWKAEMIQAHMSGVEQGIEYYKRIMEGMNEPLADSEVWFENNWKSKRIKDEIQ